MSPAQVFCLFFYSILLICGLSLVQITLADPDTLWHIAAGDLIRQTRSIPQFDSWSYTAGQTAWLNIAWLFDVLLSYLHEQSGLAAISKFTIMLMALHGTFMLYVAWRYSNNLVISLVVATFSIWSLFPSMLARPQWMTCLSALLFVFILRFHPLKAWFILPAITIFWANIHGGFLIGFLIIATHGIEAILNRDGKTLLRLMVIGTGCALATLLTPLGWHMPEAVMRTMRAAIEPYIVEWQPPQLSANPLAAFYVVLFVAISSMRSQSIPLAERLLALIFFFLALTSARMMQITATVCIPYITLSLSNILATTRFAHVLAQKNQEYISDFNSAKARLFGISLAALVTVAFWSTLPQQMLPSKAFDLPATNAPKAETDFILQHYPYIRFFTHYDFGGYIIYATRGKLPIFIDGRASTAYPRELIQDYLDVIYPRPTTPEFAPPSVEDIFAKYKVGGVMTHRGDILDRLLSINPLWQKVYEGKTASVIVRKTLVIMP